MSAAEPAVGCASAQFKSQFKGTLGGSQTFMYVHFWCASLWLCMLDWESCKHHPATTAYRGSVCACLVPALLVSLMEHTLFAGFLPQMRLKPLKLAAYCIALLTLAHTNSLLLFWLCGVSAGMGLPTPGSMAGPSSMPPSMLQTAQAAQAAHAVVNGLHAQGGGGSGFSAGPSGAPADSSNLMQQLPSISPSPPPQPPYAPPPPPYNPAQPSYNPPQPPYNNQQGYDNGTSCQQSYSNGSSQQGQGSVAGEAGELLHACYTARWCCLMLGCKHRRSGKYESGTGPTRAELGLPCQDCFLSHK